MRMVNLCKHIGTIAIVVLVFYKTALCGVPGNKNVILPSFYVYTGSKASVYFLNNMHGLLFLF